MRGTAASALRWPAAALAVALTCGEASAIDSVVVLKSDDLGVYEPTVEAFKEATERPVSVLSIEGERERAKEVVTRLRFDPPPLVFALGAKAAFMIHQEMANVPLIYGLLRDPKRYGVEGYNVTGVGVEIPYETLMSQIQLFLPEVRTLGVILTSQNPAAMELRSAARATGMELQVSAVQSSREVRGACVRLCRKVDALLLIHDPEVLTPENFRFARDNSRRAGLPLVATSEALVRAGALLAVVPDYAETGAQAAELAQRILDGGEVPSQIEPLRPDGVRVILNRSTLEALELELDPMLLDFTDEVVGEEFGR